MYNCIICKSHTWVWLNVNEFHSITHIISKSADQCARILDAPNLDVSLDIDRFQFGEAIIVCPTSPRFCKTQFRVQGHMGPVVLTLTGIRPLLNSDQWETDRSWQGTDKTIWPPETKPYDIIWCLRNLRNLLNSQVGHWPFEYVDTKKRNCLLHIWCAATSWNGGTGGRWRFAGAGAAGAVHLCCANLGAPEANLWKKFWPCGEI